MIRWIVGTSLKFRFIVLVLAAAMMLVGITQIPGIPVDAFPIRASTRGDSDPMSGTSRRRSRVLRHCSDGGGLNGLTDRKCAQSIPDLFDRTPFARDRCSAGTAAGAGVGGNGPAYASDLGSPAFMMPPVSTTGRFMKIGLSSTIPLTDMSMIAY
jgi:hypothetical protein